MQDINNIRKNGFNVVSTFTGAGGSSLGYRMAGFEVLWINEFMEKAHTKLPKIQQIIDHYDAQIMNNKVVNLEEYKQAMSLE